MHVLVTALGTGLVVALASASLPVDRQTIGLRPAADVVSESPGADASPLETPSPEASPAAEETPVASTTPAATPSHSASATPTPTPTVARVPIRINFQRSGSSLVCGYAPDYGDVYADRNGQTYGWNYSHTSGTRDRNRLTDQLLDTLAHFGSGGKWEIALPNGDHEVKVSIGDSEHSSNHTINVEGVSYWNNIYLSRWQFLQQVKTVTVSDGKLTIDQGSLGSGKTHINYVEIDTTGTTPSCSPVVGATPSASPSATSSPSVKPSLSPSPSVTASPSASPTPTGPTGPEMKVNFQLAGSPTVCDYAPDTGAVFGPRTSSLSYGWNTSHTDMTRDRNLNPDQRLDTLAHFRRGGVWEIAVENGLHQVTISIGDAGYSSTHYLYVEGVPFWNGVRLGRNEFVQTTKDVIVSDGRLTLDQGAAGDYATRINYIEIDPDNIPSVCPKPTPTPTPTSPSPSPTPTRSASASPSPSSPAGPQPLRTRQVRVNFQSWGSKTVCGYDPDFGGSYAQRNGSVYGWNFDHSDVMRDREMVAEQRLDTLAHFHSGGLWELKLRNGQHRVTVGIGDAGYESTHTLNVEGQNFWRGVHLNAGAFREMTRTVEVRDGKLTLEQGSAPDKSTRINFLTINVDGPPDGCDGSSVAQPKPAPKPQPEAPKDSTTGGGGSVGARPYGLSGLVRVFGKRCSDKANDARTWYPSTAGRGKEGYVYCHAKLARKVGGKIFGALNRSHMRGAVDYGVWGYACRIKRGGTSWSVHSWGVAIDTNTLRNPWQATRWNGHGANGKDYGKRYPRMWLNQNFYWGINFRDPMHFQYVSGY